MSDSPSSLFHSNLVVRLLSALALIPVVLGAVWVGGWAYIGLIVLFSVLGLHEWLGLTAPNMPRTGKIATQIFLLIILGSYGLVGMETTILLSAALLIVYAAICAIFKRSHAECCRADCSCLWVILGIPYVAWSSLALLHLRALPEGLALIVYLLLVVWGTDTGAYFAGRTIGGPKLLPSISPKKTWAGLIGGMVTAALMGYLVALGFGDPRLVPAALVGAVLAVVAQAGDFFESYAKRRVGAKDSGTLIPGHGGVLDRIDGLLFAALALALLVGMGE